AELQSRPVRPVAGTAAGHRRVGPGAVQPTVDPLADGGKRMIGNWTNLLPLGIVLSSLLPGLLIFTLREEQTRLRIALNLFGVMLKLGLVGLMLWGVAQGLEFRFSLPFLPGGDLVLQG